MTVINLLLLVLFHTCTIALGYLTYRQFSLKTPILFSIAASILLGLLILIPTTYGFSVLFANASDPVLLGVIFVSCLVSAIANHYFNKSNFLWKYKKLKCTVSEIVLIFFALIFSFWIMSKTFRGNMEGEIFVGSNNVFDFGFAIGLVRSISHGDNVPFQSPFQSGLPMLYHFMSVYWSAILEKLGIPLVWAVNIPSLVTFSLFIVFTYYLPQFITRSLPIAGWVSVLLTLGNSSLTFWYVVTKLLTDDSWLNSIWYMQEYPFRGPFDGSIISIFITLNNFINQRHLAFGISTGILLLLILRAYVEKSSQLSRVKITVLGVLFGLFSFWNLALWPIITFVAFLYFIFKKSYGNLMLFSVVNVLLMSLNFIPFLNQFDEFFTFLRLFFGISQSSSGVSVQSFNGLEYIWKNLSLLPVYLVLGYLFVTRERRRTVILPFIILFVFQFFLIVVFKMGFDQKLYSFLIVWINCVAAIGVAWIWEKHALIARMISLFWLFSVSLNLFINLIPIKNEFAYPLIAKDKLSLIKWIMGNTPKTSIFVTYSDIIDPVVLSGRKNYFGFFGNVGSHDRSGDVQKIYLGDGDLASAKNISYILIPLDHTGFQYDVNINELQKKYIQVYTDKQFVVLWIP